MILICSSILSKSRWMSSDCFFMACTYCSSLFFSSWRRTGDAEIGEIHFSRKPQGLTECKPGHCLFQNGRGDEGKGMERQGWVGGKVGGKNTTATVPVLPAAVHR